MPRGREQEFFGWGRRVRRVRIAKYKPLARNGFTKLITGCTQYMWGKRPFCVYFVLFKDKGNI